MNDNVQILHAFYKSVKAINRLMDAFKDQIEAKYVLLLKVCMKYTIMLLTQSGFRFDAR